MVPDVALLRIFDFYIYQDRIGAWCTLVHVCRKWRHVAFGSPRRLNLRLYYKARKPAREMLDAWPPLPIIMRVLGHERWDVDNIVTALGHKDRIYQLGLLNIPNAQFQKVLEVMQQPFPELTHLELQPKDEITPVDPASFLGGSAPRLQTLVLGRFPFPGLPTLLLSATHLVRLDIWSIPLSAYFSPEAIVASLSVLTRLETLKIAFKSTRSHPDRATRSLPVPTRSLLPVLTKFQFFGMSEYSEDFMARIDAPVLDKLEITFRHRVTSDTPQLTRFISRSPKFKASNEAHVVFSNLNLWVSLPQTFDGELKLGVPCGRPEWHLSSLTRICSSSFPRTFIPAVEHLYTLNIGFYEHNIENSQWLEFLRPFPAVKYLYLSRRVVRRIAPALQELVGERVTEVLPALQSLFLEESQGVPPPEPVEGVEQFVAARQLGSHPITVSRWEKKSLE